MGERGLIVVSINEATKTFDPGALEAMRMSVERNIEFSGLIFRTLGGLFVGETSLRQLQGPVAIAQLSGESAEAGWIALFTLMASISLNLGLLNLLPIPILDGGHLLMYGLEGLRGRPLTERMQEYAFRIGLAVILSLTVFATWNDLVHFRVVEFISGLFS